MDMILDQRIREKHEPFLIIKNAYVKFYPDKKGGIRVVAIAGNLIGEMLIKNNTVFMTNVYKKGGEK